LGSTYTKTSPIFFENIREINNIKERKCSQCEEWFPETTGYFYLRNKSKPERGYQSECKECTIKRSRNNAVKNKERTKEMQNKYYIENKEQRLKEFRQWNIDNKERRRIFNSEFQKNNPDKVKEYNAYRQMHKEHIINKQEWQSCKDYFNNECAYCGLLAENHTRTYKGELQVIDLHKEHVDHDGANDLSNCIPSCQSCNSTKNKKLLDEFYTEDNQNYTKERYDKIIKWIEEDYKQYIQPPKPKGKYTKKKL